MKGNVVCMMHSDDPAVSQRAVIARLVGAKLGSMRGRHFRPGTRLETPTDWLEAIAMITNDPASQPNGPARVQSFALLSREAREWYALNEAIQGTSSRPGSRIWSSERE
jgi:hypothetical protein